jgi:hypothetical protein
VNTPVGRVVRYDTTADMHSLKDKALFSINIPTYHSSGERVFQFPPENAYISDYGKAFYKLFGLSKIPIEDILEVAEHIIPPHRIEKLKTFNDDKKDFDKRKETFLNTNDENLLRRYARSDKLKGPNDNPNQLRIELVKAAFTDIQAPKNPAEPPNPKTPPLKQGTFSSKFSVPEDDQRPFLLKALALYENIKVLKANGDIDYPATLKAKSKLLEDLRDIAEDQYTDQKNPPHNNPKAFDHFYANKILLDQLEIRMIEKHLNKYLATIKPELRNAKQEEAIAQHLSRYNDIADPNDKKNYFAYRIGPQFQQKIWNDMYPADPQTAEQRARILVQAIALYEGHPTPSALHFVNTLIEPLMKAITRELTPKELVNLANKDAREKGLPEKPKWKDEELAPIKEGWAQHQRSGITAMEALTQKLSEVCLNNDVHGTKTAQNRILSCIRDNIIRLGSHLEPTVKPILTKSLFKEYFNQDPGPDSDKLIELMQCYGQVRKELFGPRRMMQDSRFKDEMNELLFPKRQENPLIGTVLDDLFQIRNEANIDEETRYFIDQLNQLRPPAPGKPPRPGASQEPIRGTIQDPAEGFEAESSIEGFNDL